MCLPSVVAVDTCDQYQTFFVDTLANNCLLSEMLCLWAWCALCFRGNSNDGSEWGCGIFLLNYKKIFISTTAKPLTTKLSMRVTYFEGNPTIRSWDRVWLWDKLNSLYLHYQNAYGHQNLQDGDLPSHMTLRPHGLVRSSDKLKLCPLPPCLCPPNVARWWLTFRGSYQLSQMMFYVGLWDHATTSELISSTTMPLVL